MRRHAVLWVIVLASVVIIGCDKPAQLTPANPITATPVPQGPPPGSLHVTGIATDDNGAPVPGAIVTVQPETSTAVSGVTDSSGSYSLDFQSTFRGAGEVGYVKADSPDREEFFDYLFPSADGKSVSKNLHLYRINQISAGESTSVTVVPGDMTCGLADELTCRRVHIVVPAAGVLSLACSNPALTILVWNDGVPYPGKDWPRPVTAGTQLIAEIGMSFNATASQSCRFVTSLTS